MNLQIDNIPRAAADLPRWLQSQFRRLSDMLVTVQQMDSGTLVVTGGTGFLNTKLKEVTRIVACLNAPPVAGACFVYAVASGGGTIGIAVYTSTFAVSTTPISVNWVAFGVS